MGVAILTTDVYDENGLVARDGELFDHEEDSEQQTINGQSLILPDSDFELID